MVLTFNDLFAKKDKILTDPTKRQICSRNKDTNLDWPSISESDIYEHIGINSANSENGNNLPTSTTVESVPTTSSTTSSSRRVARPTMNLPLSDSDSSSSSSSQSTSTTRRVPSSKRVRRTKRDGQRIRRQLADERRSKIDLVLAKDAIIETKDNLIASLRSQLEASSQRYEKMYHNQSRLKRKRDSEQHAESLHDSLTPEETKRKVAGEVSSLFKSVYPRTSDKNKAKFLVNMIKAGEVFGPDGADALNEEFVQVGKTKFKAWKLLRGLDMDDRTGNFGTVEILRNVEELESYKRGIFPDSSTMSNRARQLNLFSDRHVPYHCYTSVTGHKNIAFDYESVTRQVLFACGLLQKAITSSVFVAFTLDYAEICKTSKRGHVLGGIKIVDMDTKVPGSDIPMFNVADGRGGTTSGFHSAELTTCVPLHFVVGKESNEVFRKDMGIFLLLRRG